MKFSVLNTLFAQLASGEDRVLWDGLDQSGRNAMLELLTRTDAERTIVILCERCLCFCARCSRVRCWRFSSVPICL